jgi:hypothetical protein
MSVGAVVALLIATLAGSLVSPALAQSGGDTYEFESGQTLEWSGGWTLDEESTYAEDGLEAATLTKQVSLLMVMSLPNDFDMDEARDIFLDAFLESGESSVTIDRGSYGQVSYSLDLITYDDLDFGIFTLLRAGSGSTPTFAYVFLTPTSMFAAEFQAAQNEVTVDGSGLYGGVDGAGLQSQLLAAEPSTGDGADDSSDDGTDDAADDTGDDATDNTTDGTDDTADTTDDTTDDGTEEDSQGQGGLKGADGSDGSDDATDDTSNDAADDTADDSADDTSDATDDTADATDDTADETGDDGTESGETGLIDDNTFVSPAYGTVIEWSTSLVLNPDRDPNVVVDDGGIDSLALLLPGDAPTLISVTIVPAQGGSPAAYADFWSSDEYIADSAISSDSEVLLTESSSDVGAVVLLDYTDAGTPLIAYSEARLDEENGSIILIQYLTALQLVEPTLPLVQDGLTVNGEAVLDFFTLEEILEAAGL